MPTAPLKPCLHPGGCGNLTSTRYCADHLPLHQRKDEYRLSAHARGYGRRWQATSQGFLRRNPLCADPFKRHVGRPVPATQTDHIEPHCGDMKLFWDPNNWQGLCKSCHSYKTATEDGGFGRRPSQ